MVQPDFLVAQGGVGRGIFQLGLELGAVDEMTLTVGQVCRDDVFLAKGREDLVEFGMVRLVEDWRADWWVVVSKESSL